MSSLHQSHHDEDTDKRAMMKRRVTIILPESGPEIRSMARLDNDVHLEPEIIASSPVDHVSQLDRAKCSINHKHKTMIKHKKSHLHDKTNAKDANQIRTSDPAITATRKWQIHPEGLAPFPESHHLHNSAQRTRTTLLVLPSKGNVTTIHSSTAAAQDVLDRISNFMRAQSMEGTFDARTNSIHGRLSQCGFLHFVIHLWSMNDRNMNNGGSSSSDMMRSSAVVVEFQRQRGCGIGAQRIRQSLFAALQSQNGDENSIITAPSLSAGLLWKKFPLATVLKRKHQHDVQNRRAATGKNHVTKDECFEQALAMCYQLLMPSENDCQQHQNIYDQSHRLGLEQLLYLSKPCVNNNSSSSSVIAQGIVWNQGPHAPWLQTCLVRYFVQQSDNCDLYNHNSTAAMEMGQLALNILTNALVIATTSIQCRSSDADDDDGDAHLFCSEFWHTCAAHWRDNLRQEAAADGPHNAAMSAKCIRLLHELSSQHQQCKGHGSKKNDENDNQWILDDVFLADLLRAHAYGQAHHLELAVQTRQLIQHCLGGGGLM